MARLWRALGFKHLINFSLQHEALRSITKFWQGYLSFFVRAGAMTFVLREIKECVGRHSPACATHPTRHLNAETSRPRDIYQGFHSQNFCSHKLLLFSCAIQS